MTQPEPLRPRGRTVFEAKLSRTGGHQLRALCTESTMQGDVIVERLVGEFVFEKHAEARTGVERLAQDHGAINGSWLDRDWFLAPVSQNGGQ